MERIVARPQTRVLASASLRSLLVPTQTQQMQQVQQRRAYSAPAEGSVPAAKQKYIPETGTYPQGFRVAGVHVGVKASTKARFPDVALIEADDGHDYAAAAVFTKSHFAAAPVVVDRQVMQRSGGRGVRSVLINAGCANAVTGQGGLDDAWAMASEVHKTRSTENASTKVEGQPNDTMVMSTGVIGNRLPIQKILGGVSEARKRLDASHASWLATARAICTTDTFPKLRSTTFSLPSSPNITYSLAGISKGAGMMHPNMATLLGVMCTDAPIAADVLKPLLTYAVNRSFNAISVDGDTSTNDTIALLANGAAGGKQVTDVNSTDALAFREALTGVAQELAHLVVRDGEGATKFVHLRVTGARSHDEAIAIARHIAVSPLVKTALYAEDANWGRILAKAGSVPGLESERASIDPLRTSLSFVPPDGSAKLVLLQDGEPTPKLDEARAKEVLAFEDLEIKLDLGVGTESASYWTCDFSHEYVTINADYRT